MVNDKTRQEMKCSVAVLILTLNEEQNLPDCLDTLKWCDDIVVLDSGSSDRTEEIALGAGVRFCHHRFDDYASQRNAALDGVEFKYPWVFMVDADERVPPELAAEVLKATAEAEEDVDLFRMRRKDMFMGRWIKNSSGYPTWFGRLIRVGKVSFHREVHEDCVPQGREEHLVEHLIHYPFSKGLNDWFARHNHYSTVEAELRLRESQEPVKWRDVLSDDPARRRRAYKRCAFMLPFRPFLMFMALFCIRLGMFEGKPGLVYCLFRAIYEYMIDLKIKEFERRTKGQPT